MVYLVNVGSRPQHIPKHINNRIRLRVTDPLTFRYLSIRTTSLVINHMERTLVLGNGLVVWLREGLQFGQGGIVRLMLDDLILVEVAHFLVEVLLFLRVLG